LTVGDVPIGYQAALKLLKIFDHKYSGNYSFFEYATAHKFLMNAHEIFQTYDKNGKGYLRDQEAVEALLKMNISGNLKVANFLYHRYKTSDHGITFAEFLSLVSDLAIIRSNFEREDADRDGVIRVNLETAIRLVGDVQQ